MPRRELVPFSTVILLPIQSTRSKNQMVLLRQSIPIIKIDAQEGSGVLEGVEMRSHRLVRPIRFDPWLDMSGDDDVIGIVSPHLATEIPRFDKTNLLPV